MKAFRALRTLSTFTPKPDKSHLNPIFVHRFYSAQLQQTENENDNEGDSVFDSSHYRIPSLDDSHNTTTAKRKEPTWDEKYRERADRVVFGKKTPKGSLKIFEQEEEDERKNRALAKALLEAALEREEEEEEEVKEEDQKSLAVGIIGAPNAGKSAITNYMVCLRFCCFCYCVC